MTGGEGAGPFLQVVKGNPTDEELAAVVVVLSTRPAAQPVVAAPSLSGWSAYWRTRRQPLTPGPGAWRAAGREG